MTRVVAAAVMAAALLASGAQGAGAPAPVFAPTGAVNGWIGAVDDFNGDGKPDVAVVNASLITAFLDGGSGRFAAAPGSIAAGTQPAAVAAGDFNGDGHDDLAVERVDAQTGNGSIGVALGDGSAGFHPGADSALPAAVTSLSLLPADLNGDGRLDLVVRDRVMLGDGAGRFATGAKLAGAALALMDANGDKKTDVVVGVGKAVSILLGDGSGGFHAATGSPIGLSRVPVSAATGDFNGDGRIDLAVSTGDKTNILFGNGKGGFKAVGSPLSVAANSLAAGDFNGDGKADLAAACSCGVTLLLGDGKGAFSAVTASFEPTSVLLAAKDLNGDHRLDLVTSDAVLFQTAARPAAVRSAAKPSQTFLSTALPITKLAADGMSAAALTSASVGPCSEPRAHRIVVWANPHRAAQQLTTRTCVDELALGAGRVGWIERACGNSCDLTVKVAPLGSTKPKAVDFVNNGNGAGEDPSGSYVGHLLGAGSTLAFNSWVVCDANDPDHLGVTCPAKDPATGLATERLVRVAPAPTAVLKSGAAAYALVATGGGRLAVTAGSKVAIVAPNGKTTCSATTSAIPPHGVALNSATLIVESALTLDLYDPSTCAKRRSLPLGPAAQLELSGASSPFALLSGAGRVVLVRLSDGKQTALPVTSAVDAKLTQSGLFYAYDTPKRTLKGHVVFTPTAGLAKLF